MSIVKQLACRHQFKYFHKRVVPVKKTNSLQYKYLFICPHCKKIASVTEHELFESFDNFTEIVAKYRALGCKMKSDKNTNLYIKTFSKGLTNFYGAAADMMLDKYKELDLTQLSGGTHGVHD